MSAFLPGRARSRPAPAGAVSVRAALLSFALLAGPAVALDPAEALRLAEQLNPALRAQQASADGAWASQAAAAALPDPRLSLGVENLPTSGPDRWSLTRDFMTMQRLALMQEVPNAAKRAARAEAAQARADRERALLVLQRLQLRQALGTAWIAVQSAQRGRDLLQALVDENLQLQRTLPARIAGGSAAAAELVMARQEALALADRQDELTRELLKARAALRRLVGPRGDEPLSGELPLSPVQAEALRARLHAHAELAAFPAQQALARAELREAESESRGDWAWELAYSRRGRQWGDMLSFQLSFDLPWQRERRQQPMAAARQRELERVQLEREEAEQRHRLALEEDLAELQSLASQHERLTSQGLPLAQDRVSLALSAYQSGKSDLGAVLAARAQLLELRLRQNELQTRQALLQLRLNSLAEE